MKKYRLKDYDPVNDLYLLQEHMIWFLWRTISAGSKEKLNKFIEENTND
tara:strand:+ start:5634 stop:5780 length:147 start_codon:yes stop_codon:yes gene_type:complete